MPKPICKYHNIYTGLYETAMLLDRAPLDSSTVASENFCITEALAKISRRLKFNLRQWPYCGNGGDVTLNLYLADRQKKLIYGYWDCSCQHEQKTIDWEEDTLEMDS